MKEIDSRIILAYLSDKCNNRDLIIINDWMDESEQNKKWLLDMKASWDLERFKSYDNQNYLEVQFKKTWDKINGSSDRRNNGRNRRVVKIISYAAVACLIGFIIVHRILNPSTHKVEKYIVEEVGSSDSIRRVILPDQSIVWLNANSQIRYLPELGENERRVVLTGEAYFNITPNKEKPFRVETSNFTLKVLGTAFNVSSYDKDSLSNATLISGKIAIENSRQEEIVVLNPGQKARYLKNTGSFIVENVDIESEILWKSTYIIFEQTSIKQIIEKLEYVYGERIILQLVADTYPVKTYSGAVARKDSLEDVLKSLQNVAPFHSRRTNQGLIISI